MNKLKNEFLGWKNLELLWLIVSTLTILSLSIYWKDNLMGIISAITGVWCVICTAKGKLSAYFFGTINCALYAIISFKSGFYGETMLNALYYLPLQFYGFYVWNKNMNEETKEVNKKEMNLKTRMYTLLGVFICTGFYGLFLDKLGGKLPYFDALSTVVSVVAMVISIKMYTEQWILWIIVDIVTVFLWAWDFAHGNDSIATLLMWTIYLFNAIFAYKKWKKESNKQEA